jgi:futalosine hydrolase
MNIGIAASTQFEIAPAIRFLEQRHNIIRSKTFDIVITGIGSIATTYYLADFIFLNKPDFMIQAGICGSFTNKLQPGQVVLIEEEVMGDLGVEEDNRFHDIFDLGLLEPGKKPFSDKRLVNPYLSELKKFNLPEARGITVNEITTRPERIKLLVDKYNCQTESMEGAAFHYTCLQANIPFLQLRAVSNEIGERNKRNWSMQEAIENLNQKLLEIIEQIG